MKMDLCKCGAKPYCWVDHPENRNWRATYKVVCSRCQSTTQLDYESRYKAVKAWNQLAGKPGAVLLKVDNRYIFIPN